MKQTPLRRTAFRPRRRVVPVDPRVRRAVFEREGFRCFRCGKDSGRFSLHHRLPRRMGGSSDPRVAAISNLILVCGSGVELCHGWIESHRIAATTAGLLLPADAMPELEPLLLRGCRKVLLTPDGRYEEAA